MHFFSEATNHVWVRVVLGLIVLGMFVRGALSRRAAIQALLAVALANGFTDLFKHLHPEPRPYQELHDLMLHTAGSLRDAAHDMAAAAGTSMHDNAGTASAHSANMAAVAFVFCYHLRWWGAPWVLIAFVTGLSRIYLGAHYPYQVLLGWGCGCIAAFAITKTWDLVVRAKSSKGRNLDGEPVNSSHES